MLAGAGLAASPAKQVLRSVDTRLCEFPLETTIVTEPGDEAPVTRSAFTFSGPATVTLRNVDTGLRTVLSSTGSWDVDTRTGKISWRGERIWFWSTDAHVPFLRTLGNGSFDARSVLAPGTSRARVLDPCVLVATRPPSERRRSSRRRRSRDDEGAVAVAGATRSARSPTPASRRCSAG